MGGKDINLKIDGSPTHKKFLCSNFSTKQDALSFQKADKHIRGQKNAKATYSAEFGYSHFGSGHDNIKVSHGLRTTLKMRRKNYNY